MTIMPTPFTHLAIAQRLLIDPTIPRVYHNLLSAHRSAFLLGSVVADARVSSGVGREVTHFYAYDRPMTDHPWRVMLAEHPILQKPRDHNHLMFLAGYVAHLATDEAWALKMMLPNFARREWVGVERMDKFIALHLLLTHMDERDEEHLEAWQADALAQSNPDDWSPFIPDPILCAWRDLIAGQIAIDGTSQTLAIFGSRLQLDPSTLRDMLDDPQSMYHRLWRHIPPAILAQIEVQMYAFTRDQLCVYLTEFS